MLAQRREFSHSLGQEQTFDRSRLLSRDTLHHAAVLLVAERAVLRRRVQQSVRTRATPSQVTIGAFVQLGEGHCGFGAYER